MRVIMATSLTSLVQNVPLYVLLIDVMVVLHWEARVWHQRLIDVMLVLHREAQGMASAWRILLAAIVRQRGSHVAFGVLSMLLCSRSPMTCLDSTRQIWAVFKSLLRELTTDKFKDGGQHACLRNKTSAPHTSIALAIPLHTNGWQGQD